ncbi:sodium/proton antiporter NhaB [Umboniibacter marinipuniceus]|uniref:Na(+)/H(+) antiporter NhaB n=1 Tax=Umboniibacter marinipuniceus TaxID=569599 RepID=A0A3M0A9T9_9GAMM|nr:sodium/proton antiporter NhaB [Umboniibacter marinipuniceus]RMA81054.1 sodium/proton antiporter (NhaB family) [Umboniibacter marinipuniceus]
MVSNLATALSKNFLGNSPSWYKLTIIGFLIINPIILTALGPVVAGWILILEFIFTLSMALKCYPLQPGGLLAAQAVLLGLTTADAVFTETVNNIEVILLLVFMVAGIYFMQSMLLFIFTKILVGIRNKLLLSFLFCFSAAVLSAFLDALTVTAVLITVAIGFYNVYNTVYSGLVQEFGITEDEKRFHKKSLAQFRRFLRSIIMHGAVGTALGGVSTIVGEPQNLLIGERLDWNFVEFYLNMAHITMPVLGLGLLTCLALEKLKWFGYGAEIPGDVLQVLKAHEMEQTANRTTREKAEILVQAIVAIVLVLSLAFHVAEVGLIGLLVIILLTAFNGITEEHRIGHAFEEALPFTALLVVFFAIVAVIHQQHLFTPVIDAVLALPQEDQAPMFFIANGVLSMISDNVFVATVYIDEVASAYNEGLISREHFEHLAIAINTGTNLPSVATPNGQAAFLFLLTSALAPLIRLSYGRMVYMALPYTIVLGVSGFLLI